jgi:hypothetical protein
VGEPEKPIVISNPSVAGQAARPAQPVVGPSAAAQPVRMAVAAGQGARPVPVAARPVPVKPKPKPGDLPNEAAAADDAEGEEEVLDEVVKKAPPWLVSTVFHTLVVIVLGVLVTRSAPKKELELEAKIYAEQLGEQLEDPSVLVGTEQEIEEATEQIITPQELPPVEDPFAAPPEMPTMDISGPTATSDINAPVIGLALSGREAGSKNALLAAYGGNATTETAVINGLKWLAKQQKGDGSWSLTGPYSSGGTEENIPAATAMALLAFQGQGNTHKKGTFKNQVIKGWQYLLKQQGPDGNFVSKGPVHQRLYAQAQCSIAVCELYGMTGDKAYKKPAELAIKYALAAQDKRGGGWRYEPGIDSDTSVTGWYVMALQSAKMANLDVPKSALDNISRFLDSVQQDDGKVYLYKPNMFPTPAVTAEGLLCRQYLGWKQDDERLVAGVAALNSNPIDYSGEINVYYWYYATQACHHMEDRKPKHTIWSDWNKVMRQAVPDQQIKKGPEAGSWDPDGDRWGSYGGRLYTTCFSIYMLEVYYRHLPIYSGYKFTK